MPDTISTEAGTQGDATVLVPTRPAQATPPGAGDGGAMGKTALWLSLATFVSRILGLVREQVFAALLGAGFFGDAFTIAFRLPNLLRDLFAEGALSAAFQPAFQDARKQQGQADAQHLANLVATCLLVVVGLLTVMGIVWAPQLVNGWAAGFAQVPGKAELTVQLTRIMMPFLLLVSLAALAMGMLNAEKRFAPPALAPALFNMATVVTGLTLWVMGIGKTQGAALAWAVATLVGGALQLGLQVVPLYRSGYRFRPALDLRHPRLRAVLLAMAPATVGLAATQVNIYVSSRFASTEPGAASWLYYAFRLLQLPIGMFGVAVGTVALQRAADAASEADLQVALDGVRDTLRRGLRLVTFYSLPSAVILFVLAEPIIGLVYQRGAFSAEVTRATADTLRFYSLGLQCYAAVKVVVPVFYSLRLARVAVMSTVTTVLLSVVCNLVLHPLYGYRALAFSTSVGAIWNLLSLLAVFRRRYGQLIGPQMGFALLQMVAASMVLGLILSVLSPLCLGQAGTAEGLAQGHGLPVRAVIGLGLLCGVGGVGYLLLGGLFRLEEVDHFTGLLRRKLRRGQAGR